MGKDMIPPKKVIMLKDDVSYSMQSIANLIDQSTFPDQAKISSVTPAFKKDDKMDKTNYRLTSVLPCPFKILEKIIFEQIVDYVELIFSPYLSGFRKRYGCQHVLMCITTLSEGFLVTNWLAREQQMLSDVSFSFFCRFYSKPM